MPVFWVSGFAVDFSAMSDPHHKPCVATIIHLVEDAIVTNAEADHPLTTLQYLPAFRTRILSKSVDPPAQALLDRSWE